MHEEPPPPEWWHERQAISAVLAADPAADLAALDDPGVRVVAHPHPAVTVHWMTNSTTTFERVEVEETAEEVRIALFETRFRGQVTLMGAFGSCEVRLAAPLGTRRIIDPVTGRARERLPR